MAGPRDLLRIRRTKDGRIAVGPGPGRGAWVCPSPACVDRAARRDGFARALRGPVPPEAVEALRAAVAERARMDNRHT